MKDIVTAIQFTYTSAWLTRYRTFIGDNVALKSDFFAFITTPTAQRDEFIQRFCSVSYTPSDQIVIPTIVLNS